MKIEQSLFAWAQDAGWQPGPRTRNLERRIRGAVAKLARRIAPDVNAGN